MRSATVTQDALLDFPEDSPRKIQPKEGSEFPGEGQTVQDEQRRFGEGHAEPSEALTQLEAKLQEAVDGGVVVASEDVTEEFLASLSSTINVAIDDYVTSEPAEAAWTWLGDIDRWENVRGAIALTDIDDDTLTYCCLKHELAEKLLSQNRFVEALAAYVSILRAHKLDRLAMAKLSLCILALWRSESAESQAAAFLKCATKADANNEHLKTLVNVVDKIIMCDDVDLMEEMHVDNFSEGIIGLLLQIASSAEMHQRSTPLLVS